MFLKHSYHFPMLPPRRCSSPQHVTAKCYFLSNNKFDFIIYFITDSQGASKWQTGSSEHGLGHSAPQGTKRYHCILPPVMTRVNYVYSAQCSQCHKIEPVQSSLIINNYVNPYKHKQLNPRNLIHNVENKLNQFTRGK